MVASPVPAVPAPNVHLGAPTCFTGKTGDCRGFLTQCKIHFELHAPSFPTERTKVAYAVSYLAGKAEAWATPEWQNNSSCMTTFRDFSTALKRIFQEVAPGREAAQRLVCLRQGNLGASAYAVEFRTLAAEAGWDSTALCDMFVKGLSRRVKDSLASANLPTDMDQLIALVVKVDRRLWNSDCESREETH